MPEIGLGSASPLALSIVRARAGQVAAQRMVQKGESIDASLAVQLGLADRVSALSSLEAGAGEAARDLGRVSLRAYRQNRRWMYRALRSEILAATGEFSDWIDQDNEGASGDGA
jgi:enoyl-CoA hydratase/carnithine racemase